MKPAFTIIHRYALPKRLLLIMVAALSLLVTPVVFAADDAAEYEARLKELQSNIEKLQKQLDSAKGERGKLEDDLKKTETDIGELEQKVDEIDGELKTRDQQIDNLNEQKQSLNGERRAQQAQMAAQVQSVYRAGRQSPVQLLLSQETPERVSRMRKYHDYILAARTEKITHYLNTLDQLAALEPRIQKQRAELARQQQALNQRQQQLAARQQQRNATLAKLNSLIDSTDARLRENQDNSQRLQAVLDEMTVTLGQAAAPSGTPFSSLRGQLPWPADGVLRHGYGSARVAGQLNWDGLVISANTGTPVLAVHTGRVVFADYLRGHGLLIIIDHGEGYMSLYAHNQSLLRQVGDAVNGGDVIARVGASGGQSYSGLYFEIRHRGQPTNPTPWLRQA
ncbi:MAG TPA: peptidoglycan DD-metalloendopeptidase family protein [Marinobacter sp.]|nr:peptidoglycan DD-metalloendopeptidase family protein [Marinobacter sp.]